MLLVRSNGIQENVSKGSEKISYFSNPSYPSNDSSLQFSTYTIRITDTDICQVRLDLDTFELTGPSLTHYPIGECDTDRTRDGHGMGVFTNDRAVYVTPDQSQVWKLKLCSSLERMVLFTVNSDIGLSGGNQLCGNLTGQHGMNNDDIFCMYLDHFLSC